MTVPPRAVAAAVCLALLVGGPATTEPPSPDAKTVPEQPGKHAPLPEYKDVLALDIHTGFIVNDSDGVFFIHASYVGRKAVVTEAAQESPILASSKYRVLGNLSADDDLTVKWLLGEPIPARER